MSNPNEEIKGFLRKLEKAKEKAREVRDELREIVAEAEEISESFDDGVSYISSALDEIRYALDRMSEYV